MTFYNLKKNQFTGLISGYIKFINSQNMIKL